MSNHSVANPPGGVANSLVLPQLSTPFSGSTPKVEMYFDPAASINLIKALIRAKPNFSPLVKSKVGGRGKYAPLPDVLDATEPALLAEGIFVNQPLEIHGGEQCLATYLIHESGEFMKGVIKLPVPDDWQKFGSAISYARRYSIQAILNLAADDDDGQSAPPINQGARPPARSQESSKKVQTIPGKINAQQQQEFVDALQKSGYSKEARRLFLQNNGNYTHPREIPNDPQIWNTLLEMARSPKHADLYNRSVNKPATATTGAPEDDPLADPLADQLDNDFEDVPI